MKGTFLAEGEIAEKRRYVHHFLLAALLEQRNERNGEEDKSKDINVELPLPTELAAAHRGMRRQTQT